MWSLISEIDWSDPFILAITIFHILSTVIIFKTRHHETFQTVFLIFMLWLVYYSELINEKAARYWRLISRQQYFDSRGFFISIIFSVPILFNCLLIIINWLNIIINLMICIKKKKIRKENNYPSNVADKNKYD